jgi:GTPase Era involved in 16S rRNA processing
MCKEMPTIPVDRVTDKKIIMGKNGGPKKRRGTKGCPPP